MVPSPGYPFLQHPSLDAQPCGLRMRLGLGSAASFSFLTTLSSMRSGISAARREWCSKWYLHIQIWAWGQRQSNVLLVKPRATLPNAPCLWTSDRVNLRSIFKLSGRLSRPVAPPQQSGCPVRPRVAWERSLRLRARADALVDYPVVDLAGLHEEGVTGQFSQLRLARLRVGRLKIPSWPCRS